ncbi:chorismate synthase [Anaerolinea thermolimosa]|uniref:chorismate synthase n=1 Tax=Anaerolinea thermolimosa TaxID=229919 RepID=UPI000780E335|nr:chorismate synthase [Anaerolinea thermolimosa]GAP08022.1 chorismate synthase [Anaerolinea thermolimosa]
MPLRFLTAGESHGPALLAILDGLPAGLPLDEALLRRDLARRQHGYGAGPRMKLETDTARILGGVMEGRTTGAPLVLYIENSDHARWKGRAVAPFTTPRPGHADLAGALKYGLHDLRPALERASARETAARVAVGAVCRALLAEFGIRVGGYVVSIGPVEADLAGLSYADRIERALESEVSCPDVHAARQMQEAIRQVMQERDTLGGVIEVVALGLPPGLGSYAQWDRRLEARLGAAILSIQAIKGVEFGPAFQNARLPGTQVHDAIRLEAEGGWLTRPSDRSGGLEGGITTGQPLVVRAAMKPIATTLTPQPTVDLSTGEETETRYERSDFCPVPRAVVILEAMMAFVLADALLEKLGGDSLDEMRPRLDALRRARLDDLHVDNQPHIFWPE